MMPERRMLAPKPFAMADAISKYRSPEVIDVMRVAAFGARMELLGSYEEKAGATRFAALDAAEAYYAMLVSLAVESIAGVARDEAPVRMLDIGAGTGRVAYDVARSEPVHEVIAVEQSPELVNEIRLVASGVRREVSVPVTARQRMRAILRLPGPAPKLTVRLGDAHDVPAETASFTCACGFGLLDRVERPRAVVAELARVLKPGGVAIVSCLNDFSGGPASQQEWLDEAADAFTGSAWENVATRRQQLVLRQNAKWAETFDADIVVATRSGLPIPAAAPT